MKSTISRWSLILALLAVLAMVGSVAAETIRTPFDNYNVNCIIHSQTMWVEDGVLHIRDRVMSGVVESDGPYHQGTGRMVANANIDLATMYGNYWGTLEIFPDAYPEGYWAGSWSMQVTEGKVGGIARLQGDGSLKGLASKADLVPLTPPQLAAKAYLCGGNQPISGARAVGFVMDPGGE